MAYITEDEYRAITGQQAPADFAVLASEADAIVDRHTLYGLWGRDLTALPPKISGQIKIAAAHQVQYLDQRGGIAAINDFNMPGMSLGKFSYSGGGNDNAGSSVDVSPLLEGDLLVVGAYLRGIES